MNAGLERTIIESKMRHMAEMLEWLKETSMAGLEQYLTAPRFQHAAERELQTLIEAATDINVKILTSTGHGPPRDYFQSFIDVAQYTGAISMKLAQQLAPSAGLRNRLVHEYGDLVNSRVFDSIEEALLSYPRYIMSIQDYLLRSEDAG